MKYLRKLAEIGPDIAPIQAELAALEHKGFWNEYTLRTAYSETPHRVDDIWMRYRSWDEYVWLKKYASSPQAAVESFVGDVHESSWYPVSDALPCLKSFIFEAMRYWEVERLGGVLITRIPPGGEVKPHVDMGWHALAFEKIALQILSAPEQAFCYEDGEFVCEPGTIYSFCNQQPHWVVNRSATVERITAVICVKRDVRLPPLWRSE